MYYIRSNFYAVCSLVWVFMHFPLYSQQNDSLEIIEPVTVLFPRVTTPTLYQEQANYYFEIFKLALLKADIDYEIKIVDIPTMPQSRSLSNIEQSVYDIHWMTTSTEREQKLNPIRIPLLKGLLGLRIALINSKNPNTLGSIDTLDELKKLYIGQGHDWMDTDILRQQGFNIIPSSNTKTLFDLLKRGRIDYFPRSITEVWFEQTFFSDERVVVDEMIAIYYPLATYFFVRNDEHVLHQQITLGLNRALEDGSFNQVFNSYFEKYLEKAQLSKRKLYFLKNPFLPEKTPIEDERLWLKLKID